jgi:hypothetical protein
VRFDNLPSGNNRNLKSNTCKRTYRRAVKPSSLCILRRLWSDLLFQLPHPLRSKAWVNFILKTHQFRLQPLYLITPDAMKSCIRLCLYPSWRRCVDSCAQCLTPREKTADSPPAQPKSPGRDHKCQGMSLLMPSSAAKEQLLAAAGPSRSAAERPGKSATK